MYLRLWLFLKANFVGIERTVLLFCAVLALLPLMQYYGERDDRRLDRAANFLIAYEACRKQDFGEQQWLFYAWSGIEPPEEFEAELDKIENELQSLAEKRDPATLKAKLISDLTAINKEVFFQCIYIMKRNEPDDE